MLPHVPLKHVLCVLPHVSFKHVLCVLPHVPLKHVQNKKEVIQGKTKPKYSKKIYTITGIKQTNPTTYTISDFGETGFYKQQFILASEAANVELADDTTESATATELESEAEEPVKKMSPRRSARFRKVLKN